MVVSGWWLLVAFWAGGALGLVLGATAAVSRRAEDAMDRSEAARRREPLPANVSPDEALR